MTLFAYSLSTVMVLVGLVMTLLSLVDLNEGTTIYKNEVLRGKEMMDVISVRFVCGIVNLITAVLLIIFPNMLLSVIGSVTLGVPFIYFLHNRLAFSAIGKLFFNFYKLSKNILTFLFRKVSLINKKKYTTTEDFITVSQLDVGGYMATKNNTREVGVGSTKEEAIEDFKIRI